MKGLCSASAAPVKSGRNRIGSRLGGLRADTAPQLLCVLLLCITAPAGGEGFAPEHWLLIDSTAQTLTVMDGDRPQLALDDIALGRFGTSKQKLRGDNTTPLGRFRISRINQKSAFYRFIALDYPDLARSERALSDGQIDAFEMRAIHAAHRRGKLPPQGTALGGRIGIHGLGSGDAEMHASLNWTKGCVALTNEQIDTLLPWIRPGMRVEIW